MAFPALSNTVTGNTTVDSYNHTVVLPPVINSGDLLLAFFGYRNNTGTQVVPTWDNSTAGSWTELSGAGLGSATGRSANVYYKFADGTEDGKSLTVTLNDQRKSAYFVHRITGASAIQSSAAASGSTTTVNHPSFSPSWGAADTLWLALGVLTNAPSVSSYPTNYTGGIRNVAGSTNAIVSITSSRQLNAATEDPDQTTIATAQGWYAWTVAVLGAVPGLTDVDTDEIVYADQQNVTATGLNLGAVTSFTISSGSRSVVCSIDSVSSTNVQFDVANVSSIVSSNVKFGTVNFNATDAAGTGTISGTLLPNTGYDIHNITDISQVGVPTCIYYGQVPSLVVGDQILYESANVVIDTQGFPTFSNNTTQFNYYIFDSADETWGAVGTYYATSTSQLAASSRTFSIVNSPDGNRYSKYPTGNNIIAPYAVYPIATGGLFDGASIPNANSKWRIITARNASRWGWYDGGGYTFDATGAIAGDYIAIYEVRDWDGQGNNATASVTVSVS